MLIGAECIVHTDNDPPTYIQTSAKLGAVEIKCSDELKPFNLSIKHISAKRIMNADSAGNLIRSRQIREIVFK